jgi:uncharacterized protein YcnI
MRTTFFKRVSLTAAASVVVLLVSGGIASAHVDPDPIAMQAGSSGTVAFTVAHGCSGSPMIDLKLQVPAGVTNVKVVDKAGWTGTVTGTTIEFKGGTLAADKPDHFDITLTVPTQAGDIHFPAIETCQKGEIDWIQIGADGAPEPEFPAPTIKITAGPPTSAELTPPTDAPEATTAGGTTAPVTATVPAKKSSSNTGTVVVIVVVVAVVLIGGGVVLARRRGSAPKT